MIHHDWLLLSPQDWLHLVFVDWLETQRVTKLFANVVPPPGFPHECIKCGLVII
jgi:hypothetical protein